MGFIDWLFGRQDQDPQPISHPKPQPTTAAPTPQQFAQAMEALPNLQSLMAALNQGPKRPLLYRFQHDTLPEAALLNHPAFIEDLGEHRSRRFHRCFTDAKAKCIDRAATDPAAQLDPSVMQDYSQVIGSIDVQTRTQGGYTIYFLIMPPPQYTPELYFAAVVHRNGEPRRYLDPSPSTRFFTLEKSRGSFPPMVGEWMPDRSRNNHGPLPDADMNAFAEKVFQLIISTRATSDEH